ncbi:unnamed protein product, partial [Medioppia subpectinata]
EHTVRRISVLQPPHHNHTAAVAAAAAYSSPIFTTKSNHHSLGSASITSATAAAVASQLPITISSSHTVIQPVLHSGATVIENNYLFRNKSIPICIDTVNDGHRPTPTQMSTTTTQPVPTCGSDLVTSRIPLEILPAYLPHLQRPQAKITFKGPIVFPVLQNQLDNGTNLEFTVDDQRSESGYSSSSPERKTSASTTCAFKQVASLPMTSDTIGNTSAISSHKVDETDEEIEILDKDKENDKELLRLSSPVNGLVLPKTTGAVRPNTLSLRTNNGSNLVSSTLVSPDTPRPNKTCVQLYMNGHAYSGIGLKVTPRPVYCTIYKTQPMFVQQETDPNLSMYSNWTTSPLAVEDVMNMAEAPVVLGLYDSRCKHRTDSMLVTSASKADLNSTHSSYWGFRRSDEEKENLKDAIARLREDVGESAEQQAQVFRKISQMSASSAYTGDSDSDGEAGPPKRVRIFEGGFKSNEDYTYVRGRGRGKYVCEECGIRCKKPSMLKKHIRTHTDLRPYSCRHCAFAFKTKGNLTKHMKSKAHHKKCVELGIVPVPVTIDESQIDTDALAKQEMMEISCANLPEDEDEDEDEGEWDEDEEEEDDEGVPIPLIELQRMALPSVPGQFDDADIEGRARHVSESGSNATEAEEQEAARSLLILSAMGSDSDLTAIRKTSSSVSPNRSEDSPEKRKVSVIDRRISQHILNDEKQRRVSQHIHESEQQRRVSQQIHESEQQRRVSQQIHESEQQRRVSQQIHESEQQRRVSQQIHESEQQRRVSQHMHEAEMQRRMSQQIIESEQQRRVSQQIHETELHRRVSQQMMESEQQRRLSQILVLETEHQPRGIAQHMSPIGKPVTESVADFHISSAKMKPPTEPPPPLLSSPRKLSPIEQLQHQVQQQQHHLLQTTWTPNCPPDQQSRPRSYSFNDVPLAPSNHNTHHVFSPSSRLPIEPIETISEESSDESMDAFALRRYSMSVINDRHPGKPSSAHFPPVVEREEPMDLSLSTKPLEVVDGIVMPQFETPVNGSLGLRHGEFIPKAPQHVIADSIDGKSICSICSKQFSKPSQLRLHENIHYFERPFKCDSCAVSFRTKGHLQKHKRSVSHFNKVTINSTFGTPSSDNPRPFKCADCKIAFRIHGHLAKHLRSKMHIMKLECLGKLPFGMYAEMERSGVNLNEIDTTDCENSLQSLQMMAQRLYDPRQMRWASEPVPEGGPTPPVDHNNGHSFDDNNSGSHVKDEPNDAFYHSLERERKQTSGVAVTSHQTLPPMPPLLSSARLPSQLSPALML